MKRIPFFLVFITFCSPLFTQNKNVVFRESYVASEIEQIEISLIIENLFISQINGEEIILEIGSNNKNTLPEVKLENRGQTPMQNTTLFINQTRQDFSAGDICNIYIYVPSKYIAQKWKIKNQYGSIKANGLFSENSVIISSGESSCKLQNIKTEYFQLNNDSETIAIDILDLDCAYFQITGFMGPINVSLTKAPQAKSVIRTKYGIINLYLPKIENFEIEARTNHSIFVNNYTKTKKAAYDWVNYIHNQGGPLIQLQTFQGDITVGE